MIYDENTGVFNTIGRSSLQDSTNSLEADVIIRDGNSGDLTAIGNVYWIDTTNDASIRCDSMKFNKKENRVVATGTGRQPLFKSFTNAEDTLYLKADTLIVSESDSISKAKNVQAYYKVCLLYTSRCV